MKNLKEVKTIVKFKPDKQKKMPTNTLKSDFDQIPPPEQKRVKKQLKRIAKTLYDGSKAIVEANKALNNDLNSSKNPKKLELINNELDDTMDSLRERMGVILDDMKHLTNNPVTKAKIEKLATELAKAPKTEDPDPKISKDLNDLRETIDPRINKTSKPDKIINTDVPANKDNRLSKSKTTPRKLYPIEPKPITNSSPVIRRELPNPPNKENTPVVRRLGEPIVSKTYTQPTKQPISGHPYYPSTSVRRLNPTDPRNVITRPFQAGTTPNRSRSVRQITPIQQNGPTRSLSSRNIRPLPPGTYTPGQPYYGGYNPSRLQPPSTIRKPLSPAPALNPNVYRGASTTPTKQPSRPIRSPIVNPPVRYTPSKNITRQPITTSKQLDKDIELKPMPRPKQKHNQKREIIKSLSPTKKSRDPKSISPSPQKPSPNKMSPIKISTLNNSNIPIDHLSGRTTEANSVKNTLILPNKFNPEFVKGEYVIHKNFLFF